ncbi:D-aminoacyl-tRNA deacylase [Ignatzschineria rhizosphaerae]|uniref:D-aminoacyl-tRNA deacylase n=1 Tax=Ignatzschineria rhizosphaerae TaxID=2923279 RepID=A0ABY3X3B5_9GAMM|nr:D-aminoacyl-tRNA deacylase [Ignatzschineria rhizosphaerae]UNM97374.1 D-aminoacyl-tRNA deacylase [Ignatzschineria rhizosphaerae]
MKILLQRVKRADVAVEGKTIGEISQGLLALVGIEPEDNSAIVERGIDKLLKYRVFSDEAGKMNLSLIDIQGELLLVSQFTLAADTKKGLRPSFTTAAPPALGIALFDYAVKYAKTQLESVETGEFGADMQVSLINDGPVTFLLEIS